MSDLGCNCTQNRTDLHGHHPRCRLYHPDFQRPAGVPDVERTWELMELAYADDGLTVLGWADDMVVTFARPRLTRAVQFVATPEVQKSHEDEVLIVAVRVPHPDEMSLGDVLQGGGTS